MPAQTRGFLFSDLRGYSAFVERQGDHAARDLLARYRRTVRDAIGRFGGAEIRTEGDSFYVVFDSVSQAVEAGLAIQALLAQDTQPTPIRAGIGIHAGEVEDDAEQGIVSGAVNIAARICAVADPGEVLVSDIVRGLTRGYLGVRFLPRGRRKLKGITDPIAVYAVGVGHAAAGDDHRRRWPLIGAAVGGSTVLVLVIALLGGAVVREGVGSAPSPSGSDDTASPSQSDAAASTGSSGAGLDAFPSSAEEALLDVFPDEYRRRCERAAPGSMPRYVGPGPRAVGQDPTTVTRDPAFAAGIVCAPFSTKDPDEVAAWVVSDVWIDGGAEELIANRAGVLEAPAGNCVETRRAIEQWSTGPLGGQLVCFSTESGAAILYWTYDGTDVFGMATRTDGNLDALLEWWKEEAQYRRP
jgi:class 3 adenylate cyclase